MQQLYLQRCRCGLRYRRQRPRFFVLIIEFHVGVAESLNSCTSPFSIFIAFSLHTVVCHYGSEISFLVSVAIIKIIRIYRGSNRYCDLS